jgi:hypothetical protein
VAQMVAHDLASRTAEYIANEKYLHEVRIFDINIAAEGSCQPKSLGDGSYCARCTEARKS